MNDMKPVSYEQEIPDIFRAMIGVHQAIDAHGLEPGLRHLVHLRASQINRCAFCVKMHVREAREDGETSEEHAPASEAVCGTSRDHEQGAEHDAVSRDHPGEARPRVMREGALQCREGHVHDREVQRGHEGT